MDCFEVQVHEKPNDRGKPRVVVNSSGRYLIFLNRLLCFLTIFFKFRIVAVSYEAKQLGVNRKETPYLSEALRKCPELIPINIPVRRRTTGGPPRPDTSVAREATAKIVAAIKSKLDPDDSVFEFSSNDEFYIDLTKLINSFGNRFLKPHKEFWENTFLYNGDITGIPSRNYVAQRFRELCIKRKLSTLEKQEARLIMGSTIANTIVEEILNQTGFQSSVGIGSNKLIAKIVSGLHKPGSITILSPSGFDYVSSIVKAKDVPGLGGKTGKEIHQQFFRNEPTMNDIRVLSEEQLAQCATADSRREIGLEKANSILYSVNGICYKQVFAANCYETSGVTRSFPLGEYSF